MFNIDHNEFIRVLNVAMHIVMFIQMLTWTLHTSREQFPLKVVRLLWSASSLLLACIAYKYYWLFSYAVLELIWHVTICLHIWLIHKQFVLRDCANCPNRKI